MGVRKGKGGGGGGGARRQMPEPSLLPAGPADLRAISSHRTRDSLICLDLGHVATVVSANKDLTLTVH